MTESRKLRSNFAPGTSKWALRKAQWKALGIEEADLERPKIAIINTSSQLSSCFSHLDGIAAVVKESIKAAGGLAFEVRTAAPSDFITSAGRQGRYILPSRDLVTSDIEVQVDGALLDGMVCLASCDKTTPGQMMAAGRLNIPTIVVACGYQAGGEYAGQPVDIEEVFESVGKVVTGEMSLAHLSGMCDNAVRGPGVCAGMGTANSMHIVCEALGLALPGSTPILANSPRMFDFARAAGQRIVAMVNEDLKPRDILTPAAFENAVRTALALSCSTNTVRHLQAVAEEAQCEVDVYELFDRLGAEVPLLAAIRPNGNSRIEDLEAAGGTAAVMKRLESLLRLDALTVTGRTVRQNLGTLNPPASRHLRTLQDPLSRGASLLVMRGSLAPEGGIYKMGNADEKAARFVGRAKVFRGQEEAITALGQGLIPPGTVAVLKGLGPVGGPGMALASSFVAAIDGAGLSKTVAVVTDGQLSGLNRGIAIGQVCPEAGAGGPIAYVEDGDEVAIDVAHRTVDLHVDADVLAERARAAGPWQVADERGWLSVYARTVQPLARGAVLFCKAPGRPEPQSL
jgi:dihydroxy-acid dehydratase